ncbi:MAG: DNA polymerase Y family protein [Betaproteobacteria bacterium]
MQQPMLWICLLFPQLPLDVFSRGLSPAQPAQAFVVSSGGHYPTVVAANPHARDAGIRDGHLLSGALALAPGLVQRERDAAAEAHALDQLATWALTFTPMACLAPPNAVLAEISGSLQLFAGLPRLVSRLVAGAHALGYTPRLGLAPTPGAALLLARAGHTTPVTTDAQLRAALRSIPLALMDLDVRTRTTLQEAGITRFGQMTALPRDGLTRRFGADLTQTLDRTVGQIPDPRAAHLPAPRFASTLDLPAPVHDVEALGFGVQRLVQELATWLTARGLGVLRMTLTLTHERHMRQRGVPATVVPFALGAPARTPAHLLGVLRERLARVALPASVETIALASDDVVPLAGRNLGLLPGDEADAVTVPLLDRLRARLGDDAVTLLMPQAEHRPERALVDVTSTADPRRRGFSLARPSPKKRSTKPTAPPPLPDAPRPLWLLTQPQPLAHLLEAQPWVLCDGPERIESGWWDGADVRRDYFVARAPTDETMWIYRDHRYGIDDGEWFLHGLFA